jgi:hypothetical protein
MRRRTRLAQLLATATLCAVLFLSVSCGLDQKRGGLPPEAQDALETVWADLDAGSYEKIYREAADEWRRANTQEESDATFKRLREKLGAAKARAYQTATESDSTGGPLPGHTIVVSYYTNFERGEGMETFTLVERKGRWELARYFVNSNALK